MDNGQYNNSPVAWSVCLHFIRIDYGAKQRIRCTQRTVIKFFAVIDILVILLGTFANICEEKALLRFVYHLYQYPTEHHLHRAIRVFQTNKVHLRTFANSISMSVKNTIAGLRV